MKNISLVMTVGNPVVVFLSNVSLKTVSILTMGADPGEMPCCTVFHLGLHSRFMSLPYTNGKLLYKLNYFFQPIIEDLHEYSCFIEFIKRVGKKR